MNMTYTAATAATATLFTNVACTIIGDIINATTSFCAFVCGDEGDIPYYP